LPPLLPPPLLVFAPAFPAVFDAADPAAAADTVDV
jgi:hypothetical protein